MAYVLGTVLFETQGGGGDEGTGDQVVEVSTALTVRIEFGHLLKEGSIDKNATAGTKLFIDGQLHGQVFSASPGYSVAGSASLSLLPNKKYKIRVTGQNTNATTRAVWVKGVITVNG